MEHWIAFVFIEIFVVDDIHSLVVHHVASPEHVGVGFDLVVVIIVLSDLDLILIVQHSLIRILLVTLRLHLLLEALVDIQFVPIPLLSRSQVKAGLPIVHSFVRFVLMLLLELLEVSLFIQLLLLCLASLSNAHDVFIEPSTCELSISNSLLLILGCINCERRPSQLTVVLLDLLPIHLRRSHVELEELSNADVVLLLFDCL